MEVAVRPGVEILPKNCAPTAAPANLRAQPLPPAQKRWLAGGAASQDTRICPKSKP